MLMHENALFPNQVVHIRSNALDGAIGFQPALTNFGVIEIRGPQGNSIHGTMDDVLQVKRAMNEIQVASWISHPDKVEITALLRRIVDVITNLHALYRRFECQVSPSGDAFIFTGTLPARRDLPIQVTVKKEYFTQTPEEAFAEVAKGFAKVNFSIVPEIGRG